ncbi:SCO family protein [Roseomonas frigidaquae]|uniref:SCO family protein n=1 Tax=Falsiroseomonas frigidaquae TaxID=487318 RepID=A0ABX1F8I4_9PROT|nr:SCO family protein [Falsiroseomonas frigidaquae]NKE48526.1 SCO family protein [Falsiroseomonas frigidaquae]
MKEVEGRLHDREQFFQPFEARPAPDFALQDAEGRPVGLADLRGKVVVLHFIYASCPDACPLHADLIARIQEMVNLTPMREQVRFVTITTDPEHDTPEVMRGFGETHGLKPANWTFLTSGPERPQETVRLAQAFGLVFVPTGGGQQMHAVVTQVIDREGRLRAKFHGLDFNPTNLVLYLNALTHDEDGDAQAPPLPRPVPPQGLWERLRSLL